MRPLLGPLRRPRMLLLFPFLLMAVFIVIVFQWTYEDSTEIVRHSFLYNSIPSPSPTSTFKYNNTISKKFSTSDRESRFVLAFRISEQMTMAMAHTYQLARIATEWKARTVMPFILKDHLTGLPQRTKTAHTTTLDLIYNTSLFDGISAKYHILPFTDLDTFMRDGERAKVHFIHVYYFGKGGSDGLTAIGKCSESLEFTEHQNFLSSLNVETKRRRLPSFQFNVDMCCTVRSSYPTTPQDFIDGCDIDTFGNVTILINYWRGYSPSKAKKSFRLYVPKYRNKYEVPPFNLPYNKHILEATDNFVKHQTKGDMTFIGVHIRAQKLLLKHRKDKQFNDLKCITDLVSKVEQVLHSNSDNIYHTIFMGDSFVAKYSELLKNITMSHFNPFKYGLTGNKALVAQVEQNILSKASILIMCGGGSFEESISLRYHEHNPTGKVYRVCH